MNNIPAKNLEPFVSALQQLVGVENVITDPIKCLPYNTDYGRHQGHAQVVTFATDTLQVQAIVKLCNQYQIPLTARGGGTGTPGGAVPIAGGLVLSFERMNKIINFDPANRIMIVETGITNQAVQDISAQAGFFWAPDPGSAATCMIAGNLAYNAAGPRTVKYGSTRENTLGLTAITGTGDIIKTGTFTTKGAVGYDLTRLLIGSEGTLALITQATLKLTPLPETKQTLKIYYQNIASATQAVVAIMSQPIIPSALEFIDKNAVRLLRKSGINLPIECEALLMIEIDGLKNSMSEASQKIITAATNSGTLNIEIAENINSAEKLWAARKALSPALRAIAPNKISEDVVVPVAQIPALLQRLTEISQQYDIPIVNYGHAGNGNIHVNLLVDSLDPQLQPKIKTCLNLIFDSVIQLGGTLSGEHGIGLEKKEYMPKAVTSETLNFMRQIKQIFDPNNILNPGKIFPLSTDR